MAAGPGPSRGEAEVQSFDDTGFRSGINACRNGKSRSDLSKGGVFGVKRNADRNALDDLCEIPGGVLRRDDATSRGPNP
jgi:hypothetical protein